MINKKPYSRLTDDEKEMLWLRIQDSNKALVTTRKNRFLYVGAVLSIAACLLICVLIPIGNDSDIIQSQSDIIALSQIKAPISNSAEIELYTDKSEQATVIPNKTCVTYDSSGNLAIDSSRKSSSKNSSISESDFTNINQLIVPYGKRSRLELSDGTILHVNAGSRVVYPSVFEDKIREVYVEGEVFLDVAKDPNKPFIVRTSELSVKVLGTSFNVKTKKNSDVPEVLLVEGVVNVETQLDDCIQLKPSELFRIENSSPMVKVVDVDQYISWKDGLFKFDKESFSMIVTKLSKYYGRDVILQIKDEDIIFSGTLKLSDNFEDVLNGLQNLFPIKYSVVNEKIIINSNV